MPRSFLIKKTDHDESDQAKSPLMSTGSGSPSTVDGFRNADRIDEEMSAQDEENSAVTTEEEIDVVSADDVDVNRNDTIDLSVHKGEFLSFSSQQSSVFIDDYQ